MRTITIKDIPGAVHEALKSQAMAHGRSLNKEIIAVLSEAVRCSPIDSEAIIRQAGAVRETMGIYLTQTELDARKAEGRG